jgi:hypothetical protein
VPRRGSTKHQVSPGVNAGLKRDVNVAVTLKGGASFRTFAAGAEPGVYARITRRPTRPSPAGCCSTDHA